jgi:multidrug resistance protein MdtO
MAGAILGSVAALLAIVFVVPSLDTVAGLIVLVAPVTFLAAWIAAGPERFGYLGLQVGFAFYLALLGRSGPTTDLHEARDRIVGVLLGVVLVVLALEGLTPRGRKSLSAVTGGN